MRGDLVLVDLILGVGEVAISDHRSSQPTLDELLRVAADAHVGGLMSGKAGILHLHVGDGDARPRSLVRDALDRSEIPAPVFHPTHVNRRGRLFEEALALAERGCTIDITAFPVAEDEDGWSAADGADRATSTAGLPPERVTVSSDGGGCLPVFDRDGRVVEHGRGPPGRARRDAARSWWRAGSRWSGCCRPFTSQSGRGCCGCTRKGRLGGRGRRRPRGARRARRGGGGDGAGAVARARGAGGGAGDVRVAGPLSP